MEPKLENQATLFRAEGIVQRVGFRRFVERAARKFKLSGYVENVKDGSVKILAQGAEDAIQQFSSEVKRAPAPIYVEQFDSKKVRVIPSIKTFVVKIGPIAMELQEGFGAMEAQFGDYRNEFSGFVGEFRDFRGEFKDFRAEFKDFRSEFKDFRAEFKDYRAEFKDYRAEFRDYKDEFRQFAGRTDENFKSLDTKYAEISAKLTHILETLEKESTETRRELTRAVDSLVAVVAKSLSGKSD